MFASPLPKPLLATSADAAQTVVALLQRREARRHRAGVVAGAVGGRAVVERVEVFGEIGSLDVLDVVHVQAVGAAGAGVDLGDEVAHFVHVGGLRGDHHDAVAVFQRNEARHAGHGRIALAAEHLVELRHQRGGFHVLQRDHRHRHAAQPVHVEGAHGALVIGQFVRRAGHHQDVALRIDQQEGFRPRERLQQFLHRVGGHVMQRKQARGITAARRGRTESRHQVAGGGLLGRHHHIAAILQHQRVVGPRQQHLQHRQHLRLIDRLRGGEGDVAGDAGGDRVVLVQLSPKIVFTAACTGRFSKLKVIAPAPCAAPTGIGARAALSLTKLPLPIDVVVCGDTCTSGSTEPCEVGGGGGVCVPAIASRSSEWSSSGRVLAVQPASNASSITRIGVIHFILLTSGLTLAAGGLASDLVAAAADGVAVVAGVVPALRPGGAAARSAA